MAHRLITRLKTYLLLPDHGGGRLCKISYNVVVGVLVSVTVFAVVGREVEPGLRCWSCQLPPLSLCLGSILAVVYFATPRYIGRLAGVASAFVLLLTSFYVGLSDTHAAILYRATYSDIAIGMAGLCMLLATLPDLVPDRLPGHIIASLLVVGIMVAAAKFFLIDHNFYPAGLPISWCISVLITIGAQRNRGHFTNPGDLFRSWVAMIYAVVIAMISTWVVTELAHQRGFQGLLVLSLALVLGSIASLPLIFLARTLLMRIKSQQDGLQMELHARRLLLSSTEGVAHVGVWEWDLREDVFLISAYLAKTLGLPNRGSWRRRDLEIMFEPGGSFPPRTLPSTEGWTRWEAKSQFSNIAVKGTGRTFEVAGHRIVLGLALAQGSGASTQEAPPRQVVPIDLLKDDLWLETIDPPREVMALGPILERIVEMEHTGALASGVVLRLVNTSCWVVAEPIAIGRVVQLLIQSALLHRETERIVVGCLRSQGRVRLCVIRTFSHQMSSGTLPPIQENRLAITAGHVAGLAGYGALTRASTQRSERFEFFLDLASLPSSPVPAPSRESMPATILLFAGLGSPDLRLIIEKGGYVVLDLEGSLVDFNPDVDTIPDAVVIDFRHRQWSWGFGVIKAIRTTYRWDIPVLMICESLPKSIFRVPVVTNILINPSDGEAVRVALTSLIHSQPWAL